MVCLLALLLVGSAPRAPETPESLVRDKLLAPLAAKDEARSAYYRGPPPAMERRVRLLDAAPIADGKGGAFVGFTVDARYGRGEGKWREGVITRCVYPATGEGVLRHRDAVRAGRLVAWEVT